MIEWHKEVCKRDNYICQICKVSYNYPCFFNDNNINTMVCGHHIKSKGSSPELVLETDNGICIDFNCHTKEHNKK